MRRGSESRRVRGMFGTARVLGLAPATLIVGGLAISYALGGYPRTGVIVGPLSAWMIIWALGALLLALTVRAFFLRIVVDEKSVRVRQWFWTTTIPLDEVTAIYPASYLGLLNQGGFGDLGLGALVPMIEVAGFRRGEWATINFPATLSPFWLVYGKVGRLRAAVEAVTGREIQEWPYGSSDGPGLTIK